MDLQLLACSPRMRQIVGSRPNVVKQILYYYVFNAVLIICKLMKLAEKM